MQKLLSALVGIFCFAGHSLSGQTLYAAKGSNGANGILYTINPATGGIASTIGPILVGATPIPITGLAFSPINGTLYGSTSGFGNLVKSFVTINPATGAATLIGAVGGLGSAVNDLSFDRTGVLYGLRGGSNAGGATLGTINLGTGVFTPIGATISPPVQGDGLTFSAMSPFTLFISVLGSSGALQTDNPATGVVTTGPTLTGAPRSGAINSMASNNAGVIYAANSDQGGIARVNLVTINTATGAVTNIGPLPDDTDAIAFQITGGGGNPAPSGAPISPASLVIIAIGVGVIALYGLRGKSLFQRG
jgi:hypothetical protein